MLIYHAGLVGLDRSRKGSLIFENLLKTYRHRKMVMHCLLFFSVNETYHLNAKIRQVFLDYVDYAELVHA